uniref:ferredoxin:thioredoxin reductase n=1 Tax=Chromera velia CCMP2878 TaxID=1169474 RepID=A0A0G4FKQ3_9ALVE|eukprot:Cvel_17454.t1-p1 / transcript=Cvel_17454.t1 / gene=Cvel_17454 / organism=Chromera_velia_CCMP2878 / gene_product=Ferredoxin-thioredoxin reductase, catalytic chain, putative / transcript_product=Ferredoxin-thioredoxin reductase, catalytic chain, putative / location=Cvel_scaffold1393:40524-43018(+) / protein_length=166 / sequence_SO=supercontig / SO=protein_coding / is_pseudo=false
MPGANRRGLQLPSGTSNFGSTKRAALLLEKETPLSSSSSTPKNSKPPSPVSKEMTAMWKFAEQYARVTDTVFCSEPEVTSTVLQGLAVNKRELGAPLCPCRSYNDMQAEVKNAYWNCPCVPMQERKECHCMLFLPKDTEFAGETGTIDIEHLIAAEEAGASTEVVF